MVEIKIAVGGIDKLNIPFTTIKDTIGWSIINVGV